MENGKEIEQKIDALAGAVKIGFDEVGQRFDRLEGRVDGLEGRFDGLEKKVNTLPDRDDLDRAVATIKGELIVKDRHLNEKIEYVVSLLHERGVFNAHDVERIQREYQVFPTTPSVHHRDERNA
jgi:hypothetical protein